MSKFKVGDHVAFYTSLGRTIGTVTQALNEELHIRLDVNPSDRCLVKAHPKQCRRLVKKERRRVYIPDVYLKKLLEDSVDAQCQHQISTHPVLDDDVEFIEVRKKK